MYGFYVCSVISVRCVLCVVYLFFSPVRVVIDVIYSASSYLICCVLVVHELSYVLEFCFSASGSL